MPPQRQHGFSLLTSTALIALAGAGAALGALPGLAVPQPWAAAPLPLFGLALWLRQRQERRIAARLRGLRIRVALPIPPESLGGEALAFQPGGGLWRARRQGWQIDLRHGEGELAWQLLLARLDSPQPAQPLASAGSLDALLRLARGLLPRMAEPGLASLLDCDLCFPLSGLDRQGGAVTALAEGGYALLGPEGCRAVIPAWAEGMIRRGGMVSAA
ncbi:hypothetical protein [Roseomonas marmotae]|uniref:DUF58 domain-containing protein n=1 Tax=Roseomonas marmotae TaxID=2768161 RepID=A0ABS3KF66_9PROT|nr:hypothetical protein [Roseomonas marmotae]MBO1076062.1 hypothetical protein [Roseomonas marmotae]QTI81301.1 hypothetical protein IAI58_18260 [Roseomonas marmotae]